MAEAGIQTGEELLSVECLAALMEREDVTGAFCRNNFRTDPLLHRYYSPYR